MRGAKVSKRALFPRKIPRRPDDPERKLSFVQFQNRHFLVWANYGYVGPDDDEKTIAETLKLKEK